MPCTLERFFPICRVSMDFIIWFHSQTNYELFVSFCLPRWKWVFLVDERSFTFQRTFDDQFYDGNWTAFRKMRFGLRLTLFRPLCNVKPQKNYFNILNLILKVNNRPTELLNNLATWNLRLNLFEEYNKTRCRFKMVEWSLFWNRQSNEEKNTKTENR